MATSHPPSGKPLAPRYGRHGPRSKNGCNTCRTRKVKCDETRDVCNRCAKAQIQCDWDRPLRNNRATIQSGQQSTTSSPIKDKSGSEWVGHKAGSIYTSPSNSRSVASTSTGPIPESPASFRGLDFGAIYETASPYAIQPPHELQLSPEDLEAFGYIPRSFMVLRFGKPWRWSMLSYVHSTVAFREIGVMRAFIAVALMELRTRELTRLSDLPLSPTSTNTARTFRKNASKSLHLAMQDLSSLLDRVALAPNEPEMLEALFSMWFLILHFGIYDSHLVDMSYMHLDGIRSFIAEYFHGSETNRIHSLPPAAKQLLVYICYLDVMLALGSMGGGQLSLDLMRAPLESPVSYTRLFEEARTCVPQLWGAAYPVKELLDDIENYRPLRFLNTCQMLKLKVWELGVIAKTDAVNQDEMEAMWSSISALEKEYYDILLLARQASNTGGRRVIWTVYHASLDYHALIILYSCINTADTVPSWLDNSITDLLAIAHKALNEDSQHVYRYAWALQMAAFKVKDPIHRDWLQGQTQKASLLLSNLGIPSQQPAEVNIRDILFLAPDRTNSIISHSPDLI